METGPISIPHYLLLGGFLFSVLSFLGARKPTFTACSVPTGPFNFGHHAGGMAEAETSIAVASPGQRQTIMDVPAWVGGIATCSRGKSRR